MTSPILYQNSDQSVFLIDIPTSIESAQVTSPNSQYPDNNTATIKTNPTASCNVYRQLLSSKPLENPYPAPPEPKSQAARARLLARIPESEILFHESIAPSIQNGVDEIRKSYQGAKWCRPRKMKAVDEHGDSTNFISDDGSDTKPMHEHEKTSEPQRKKMRKSTSSYNERDSAYLSSQYTNNTMNQPPLILSPTSINEFSGLSDLRGIYVKNPSNTDSVTIQASESDTEEVVTYNVPPESSFILTNLSSNQPHSQVIPGLSPAEKFNIIIFDPPWPNRSVRRSSQYSTHGYLEMDSLVTIMQQTILTHLDFRDSTTTSVVGIWTTNNAKSRQAAQEAFERTGLEISEIWIWLKTTVNGELVSPLDGLWRKPYEVMFLGRPGKKKAAQKEQEENECPFKRVMAAVPDEHSRKPNLKKLLEDLFFRADGDEKIKNYTALEVFARNLTAGWSACGNDVLKFNADQWWLQS